MTTTSKIDEIYSAMAEFSAASFRPNPNVMAFVYTADDGTVTGGITIFYDRAYRSSGQEAAEFNVVDYMHDHDLYMDHTYRLIPVGEAFPGTMMTWCPMDGPAIISDHVLDYIGRYRDSGSADPRPQDPEDLGSEAGATK